MSDQWECTQFILRTVTTISGERLGRTEPVMRRKLNGKWEYRKPTPEEEAEYLSGSAW